MMTRHWIIIFCLSFLVVSCATRHNRRLDNLNLPIKVLQKSIIESLPLGKPSADRSGMTFKSRPFIPTGKKVRLATKSATRFIATAYILGDRRPYAIEVEVTKQRRVGGPWTSPVYDDVGTDQRIAQIIVRRIQKRLKSRDNKRNVIDDFRVF